MCGQYKNPPMQAIFSFNRSGAALVAPLRFYSGCTHVSGSPIIQDGKPVGAVTHVPVNDPTTGHDIIIENMLDAAKNGII